MDELKKLVLGLEGKMASLNHLKNSIMTGGVTVAQVTEFNQ